MQKHSASAANKGDYMKWITREKVKVDRVACPWLIKKFIDPDAEFLFIPADKVLPIAEEQKAIAYDIPGVKYAHHDGRCSFEALITGYKLTDPALLLLKNSPWSRRYKRLAWST